MLLLKYPTRGRPEVFKNTFSLYRDKLSGKHPYCFIVSMDVDDPEMNNQNITEWLDQQKNVIYCYGNNRSKVQAINANMECVNFDYSVLLLVSDDMIPEVHGYDDVIVTKMQEHFPNLDGCLHFNDGRAAATLNTLSIMGKKMYENFGYIYHPDYCSLWCDNEFHLTTQMNSKSVYIDQVIIRHSWTDVTGQDRLHQKNESFYEADKQVFLARQAANFPKDSCLSRVSTRSHDQRRRNRRR